MSENKASEARREYLAMVKAMKKERAAKSETPTPTRRSKPARRPYYGMKQRGGQAASVAGYSSYCTGNPDTCSCYDCSS